MNSIAPCLLVATPWLKCPYFNHTVVLLIDHKPDGAIGFVVNRASDLTYGSVLGQLGMSNLKPAVNETPVLLGGPVTPNSGWLIFDEPNTTGQVYQDAMQVTEHVRISPSRDVLEHIAQGVGPDRYVFLLGYAGWGANQLEQELEQGSWLPAAIDERIVFELPFEERWQAALSQLGIDPSRMVENNKAATN